MTDTWTADHNGPVDVAEPAPLAGPDDTTRTVIQLARAIAKAAE